MAVIVTQQDKALLNLVSKKEAKSYNTVYGGKQIPLQQMTLAEVYQWQDDILAQKGKKWSSAIGKYQFIKSTLIAATKLLKVDPTQTRCTPDVQDALIIGILKSSRGYEKFKSKSLGASEEDNAKEFCVRLAMEFASIPVPIPVAAGSRGKDAPKVNLSKGSTFYPDGVNNAHHDPDTFVQQLIDIRTGGPGTNVKTIETANGSVDGSNANNPTGESPKAQLENFATGGGTQAGRRVTGQENNASQRQANGLPPADDPYLYEVIDPLDDRYDFRTGKKVTDLTLYGTSSVAAYNQANSETAAATPASQLGVASADGVQDLENWTEEEVKQLMNSRDRVATQPGRYSDVYVDPYNPAQLLTVPGRLPPAPIQGSTPNRGAPNAGNAGPEQSRSLPQPPAAAATGPRPNAYPGTVPPNQTFGSAGATDQTNKRDIALKLQKDLNKLKQDISDVIADMSVVVENQVNLYLADLNSQLSLAYDSLTTADNALTAAQASGDPVAIREAERAVFSAQGRINNIEAKIAQGSPYGLTTAEKQRRAKSDINYNQLLNQLNDLLAQVSNIVAQANSLSIDLIKPNATVNLGSVPPVVSFS